MTRSQREQEMLSSDSDIHSALHARVDSQAALCFSIIRHIGQQTQESDRPTDPHLTPLMTIS
jgi:hypothetical protein